jgi:K+-sensing histidine kinase KdpD
VVFLEEDRSGLKAPRKDAAWQLGALQALTDAALSSPDTRVSFRHLLRLLTRYVDADAGGIVLREESGDALTVQAAYVPGHPPAEGLEVDGECSLAARAVREKRLCAYPPPEDETALPRPPECQGHFHSCAAAPLSTGASVIGVVEVARLDERVFAPAEILRLDLASGVISLAVTGLRCHDFEARASELTGALRAKRDELRMILQELRRHLLSLAGSINVLMKIGDKLPMEQRLGNLDGIRRDAVELADEASALLKLSTMDTGVGPIRRNPVDLEKVLRQTSEEFRLASLDHPIELHVQDPLPFVLGDARWLKRATANLLLNALRCSPPGSPVTVSATRRDDRVLVRMGNQGRGTPTAHPNGMFRPSATLKCQGTEPEAGAGMRLTVSQRVIERCGGRIWAENAADQGSTFYFELPIAPEAD